MKIIETQVFTTKVTELLPDESYRALQQELIMCPHAGDIIPGSGGLRKLRWRLPGTGKRGGLRVIYYLDLPDAVYLLAVYRKSRQNDLTPKQVTILKTLVQEYLR